MSLQRSCREAASDKEEKTVTPWSLNAEAGWARVELPASMASLAFCIPGVPTLLPVNVVFGRLLVICACQFKCRGRSNATKMYDTCVDLHP